MDEAKPFWEESYKREGKLDTFYGGKPAPDVVLVASKLKKGTKVLDLGCGEGRNSVYLAENGFEVVASDRSVAGIEKLQKISQELGFKIATSVCDMRDFDFDHDYGLVVNHSCLQYMRREDWQQLIKKMKESTLPGGFNIIDVFTDDVPEPEDQKGLMIGLFKSGELAKLYDDWEIIEERPYQIEHTHPNGPTHRHSGENLIAQKPG